MRIEDRDEFIDAVAQAVIDRIEEKSHIHGLVEMVVQRVLQLQKESAEGEEGKADTASADTVPE